MRHYLIQEVKDDAVVGSPMFVEAVSRKDAIRRAGAAVVYSFMSYAVIRVTTLKSRSRIQHSGTRDYHVGFTRSVANIS